MAKQYQIADEGEEITSRKPGGEDPDIEVEVESPPVDEPNSSELSDEELFDDITPVRSKTPDKGDDEDEEEIDSPDPDGDEEEEEVPTPRDKFEKRLARERRLLREAHEEMREMREEMKHFRDRVVKRDAEEKLAQVKAETDTKLQKLRTDLAAAIEAGDTAEQVRLNEEILDAKVELRARESEAKASKEATETAPETSRAQRAASQWIRKHARYHTDPVFKAAAIALDKDLIAKGSDNADPEHFEKIDKELSKRFPEEYRDRKPSKRRESPVHGGRSGGEPRQQKSGGFIRRGKKVIVSASQAENMRRFGLDPDSAEDVKAYVRENV